MNKIKKITQKDTLAQIRKKMPLPTKKFKDKKNKKIFKSISEDFTDLC